MRTTIFYNLNPLLISSVESMEHTNHVSHGILSSILLLQSTMEPDRGDKDKDIENTERYFTASDDITDAVIYNRVSKKIEKYSTTPDSEVPKYSSTPGNEAQNYSSTPVNEAQKYNTTSDNEAQKYSSTPVNEAQKYNTTSDNEAQKYSSPAFKGFAHRAAHGCPRNSICRIN